MWAEKLIIMIAQEAGKAGVKRKTNLKEEGTSEACPNEEEVWRVWHMTSRVHIIQPQIEQRKGGFHAL